MAETRSHQPVAPTSGAVSGMGSPCQKQGLTLSPTKMKSESRWRLAAVLPNLQPDSSFDFKWVSIVPNNDPRLDDIRATNKAARALLDGFVDQGRRRLRPAAMIYDSRNQFKSTWLAILDARNILAVSCAVNGWQLTIGHPNSFIIRYTDYFDFYPRQPSEDGRTLVYQGPAMGLVLQVGRVFSAQPHAYIRPSGGLLSKIQPDAELFQNVCKSWRRIHVSKRARAQDHRLMRSLSLAYEAARVPQAMDNPLYDHGKHTALWISAFETLAHPGRGFVNVDTVLDLLGKCRFDDSRVVRRNLMRVSRNPRNKRSLNLPQRLYVRLYRARNAFLHGNNLRLSAFIPRVLGEGIRLLDVAPLLYLTALESYLGLHVGTGKKKTSSLAKQIRSLMSHQALEEGLCRAMGL